MLDPADDRVTCGTCTGSGEHWHGHEPCRHCNGRRVCDCYACHEAHDCQRCTDCGEPHEGQNERCAACRCQECGDLGVVGEGGAMTDCPRCA